MNTNELVKAGLNEKSGPQMAHQNGPPKSGPGKSDVRYWKPRLVHRVSHGQVIPEWYARIQHDGRREWFNLGTPNQTAAAAQARDIYAHLAGNGWESTLQKFKGGGAASLTLAIGQYITAVESTGLIRAKTFRNYTVCLRSIVSQAFGLKGDASKYDYKQGGNQKWLERVHSIRLEKLTPPRVERWMRARLAAAGNSPVEQARQRHNVNTMIRCARSLFSKAVVKKLGHLALPNPLPFAGIELYPAGSMRYQSRINAQLLIAQARAELKDTAPEDYVIFLLGLFAGLRKAEIDSLEWRMIDFENSVIRLEETEFLHLKTPGSADEIPIDSEVAEELRAMMGASKSAFVVPSDRRPRNDTTFAYYRCQGAFERLNAWLRGKGVDARKPLHELRKELGAIIASESGIFAASRMLRHADIGITSRHYVDQKRRVVSGLGKFLKAELKVTAETTPQVA